MSGNTPRYPRGATPSTPSTPTPTPCRPTWSGPGPRPEPGRARSGLVGAGHHTWWSVAPATVSSMVRGIVPQIAKCACWAIRRCGSTHPAYRTFQPSARLRLCQNRSSRPGKRTASHAARRSHGEQAGPVRGRLVRCVRPTPARSAWPATQTSCIYGEGVGAEGAQAQRMRVPLADGTLVAGPGRASRGPRPELPRRLRCARRASSKRATPPAGCVVSRQMLDRAGSTGVQGARRTDLQGLWVSRDRTSRVGAIPAGVAASPSRASASAVGILPRRPDPRPCACHSSAPLARSDPARENLASLVKTLVYSATRGRVQPLRP
jgi:hypothetical protein